MATTAGERTHGVKLVLDEHYSSAIAKQLRLRGYDVIAVTERPNADGPFLRRMPDEELLQWATDEGRVLVTENVRDFMPLHHTYLARDGLHAGMLLVSPRKFPRRAGTIGSLVEALAEFVDGHDASAIVGEVAWL
jgi:hypothetical protein